MTIYMTYLPTKADGNCFFGAIFYGCQYHHEQICKKLLKKVLTSSAHQQLFFLDEHLREVCHLEIFAAASLLQYIKSLTYYWELYYPQSCLHWNAHVQRCHYETVKMMELPKHNSWTFLLFFFTFYSHLYQAVGLSTFTLYH